MLKKLSILLLEKSINFDPNNQHVRCLAHIINLAAKKAVENLYEFNNLDDFDETDEESQEIEKESDEPLNIIYKVGYNYREIIFIY